MAIEDVSAPGRVEFDGGSVTVVLEGLANGATESIEMTLRAVGYSAPTGQPVARCGHGSPPSMTHIVKSWAAQPVDDLEQSFNGGDLKSLFEVDVYDPRRWTWSSGTIEMLEGWSSEASVNARGDRWVDWSFQPQAQPSS